MNLSLDNSILTLVTFVPLAGAAIGTFVCLRLSSRYWILFSRSICRSISSEL